MSRDGRPLFVVSAFGSINDAILMKSGAVRAVRQAILSTGDIEAASSIITTIHLDQIGFLAHRDALARFFARGGRLIYNGHLLRPFVAGLAAFVPLAKPRPDDFALTQLKDHPIFAGVDVASLMERRGVAGFYGRGHVPLPSGAEAITGLGPLRLPVDWQWALPGGGTIFLHAGNDLWGIAERDADNERLASNMIDWSLGKGSEAA